METTFVYMAKFEGDDVFIEAQSFTKALEIARAWAKNTYECDKDPDSLQEIGEGPVLR